MRVLEIVNTIPGETFIREHATAVLRHTDIDLHWAAWQSGQTGFVQAPVQGMNDVYMLPNYNRMGFGGKLKQSLSYVLTHGKKPHPMVLVKEAVARLKPDLIHFQFASLAAQHHSWAIELNVPYTFSVRGSDVQVEPLNDKNYLDRLLKAADHAAGIHLVCGQLGQLLERYAGKQLPTKIIRTSLSTAWLDVKRSPLPDKIVSVGRLHWRKDFATLILAASELKKRGVSCQFHIFGDGPARDQLEFMIRDLGLEDVVCLRGKVTHQELLEEFVSATIYAQTSLAEGFPNAVGEAMLAGIPVVSTICGGVDELLGNKENALLARTSDFKTVADHIAFFLEHPEEAKRMSDLARDTAMAHFKPSKHGEEFAEFWKGVCR